MKVPWLFVAVCVIGGCTMPTKQEPAAPSAEVSVYRAPSLDDSIFRMGFGVDGRLLAELDPGDEYRFTISPGGHSFRFVLGVYDCTEEVELRSGERYTYRLARGCAFERVDDRGPDADPALGTTSG